MDGALVLDAQAVTNAGTPLNGLDRERNPDSKPVGCESRSCPDGGQAESSNARTTPAVTAYLTFLGFDCWIDIEAELKVMKITERTVQPEEVGLRRQSRCSIT